MKILFINSVQTSPLTPLQCGEGKNVETSYHGVSDGACSVLPSPHWRRVGDEVREGSGMRSIPEVLNK